MLLCLDIGAPLTCHACDSHPTESDNAEGSLAEVLVLKWRLFEIRNLSYRVLVLVGSFVRKNPKATSELAPPPRFDKEWLSHLQQDAIL